jgi:hypothetical protein
MIVYGVGLTAGILPVTLITRSLPRPVAAPGSPANARVK